jgi:hypothetical protein
VSLDKVPRVDSIEEYDLETGAGAGVPPRGLDGQIGQGSGVP